MSSDGNARLGIWLTFGGTILAALIAGVFTLVAARGSGGDSGPTPAAAGRSTTQTVATTGTAGAATTPPGTTTPAVADAEIRWQNQLAMQSTINSDRMDLDALPPRLVQGSKGDLDALSVTDDATLGRAVEGDATVAQFTGNGAPAFAVCRDTALAQGVAEVRGVAAGAVLCVKTTEGRIARLTVKKIDGRSHTITFDALVWAPAN
jgi:hypothetical protein